MVLFFGASLSTTRALKSATEVTFVIHTRYIHCFVEEVDVKAVLGCTSTLVPMYIPTLAT